MPAIWTHIVHVWEQAWLRAVHCTRHNQFDRFPRLAEGLQLTDDIVAHHVQDRVVIDLQQQVVLIQSAVLKVNKVSVRIC